jgi:opacity protein-like surface antigen
MLANISVSFSYDYWHLFVRAGAGVAYGSKDLEKENPSGDIIVHRASGWGPGYTLGAGVAIPLASMVSLAFYGNWNVGHYDMVSPQGLIERDAKHQYLELGVGVTVR